MMDTPLLILRDTSVTMRACKNDGHTTVDIERHLYHYESLYK